MQILRMTFNERNRVPYTEDRTIRSVEEYYRMDKACTRWPGEPWKRVTLDNGQVIELPADRDLVQRDAYGSTRMRLVEA